MELKKLMLATKCSDVSKLSYPVLASPKLDGVRCALHPDHGPITRNFKPIANDYIREKLQWSSNLCLDGEIVTFTDGKMDDFNTVSGNVRRKSGKPDFRLLVFDCFQYPDDHFDIRLASARDAVAADTTGTLEMVPHEEISLSPVLERYESLMVQTGYEGVMVRHPRGPYKQGRSTEREGYLLKIKRFEDDEATIVGSIEEVSKDNVPKGRLGALIVYHPTFGEFQVGSGFTADQRQAFWHNKEDLIASVITFTYQPSGMGQKPRFPTFKGFRQVGT